MCEHFLREKKKLHENFPDLQYVNVLLCWVASFPGSALHLRECIPFLFVYSCVTLLGFSFGSVSLVCAAETDSCWNIGVVFYTCTNHTHKHTQVGPYPCSDENTPGVVYISWKCHSWLGHFHPAVGEGQVWVSCCTTVDEECLYEATEPRLPWPARKVQRGVCV